MNVTVGEGVSQASSFVLSPSSSNNNSVFPVQLGFVSFVYPVWVLQIEVLDGCHLKCSLLSKVSLSRIS